MASSKFVLRTDKLRADGTAPLYLRLTHRRRSRYVATGIYLDPKDWNEERQQVRRSHPMAPRLNRHLESIRLQAQAELLETGDLLRVKASLKGSGDRSLLELATRHAELLEQDGRYWSSKQQRVLIAKLEAFRPDARLEDLSPAFVEDFRRFLEQRLQNAPNTVRKNLQCLRRVWRYGVELGLLDPSSDPFRGVRLPKETVPERERLTFEEIRRLAKLELPPPPAAITRARDAFLLAAYLGGMRFGDLCRLRVDNFREEGDEVWLRYRMAKTGRWVELPVPPEALKIVRRWDGPWRPLIFPFLRPAELADPNRQRRRISSMNAAVNAQLKVLARMAGIEKRLSMHVARHSVADLARQRTGDVYAISKLLAHGSLEVTAHYLSSFDRSVVRQLSRQLWESDHE